MADDPKYDIPVNPIYDDEIRKLKNDDEANATTVFNPLFQQIITNIAALKIAVENSASGAGDIEVTYQGDTTTLDVVLADLTGHLDDELPHKFVDGGVTYKWGLKVIGGVVNFVYEPV